MSDTPRTDAAAQFITGHAVIDAWPVEGGTQEVVDVDFARQLERELAEARKDAERYRWLRECSPYRSDRSITIVRNNYQLGTFTHSDSPYCEELDAAIDAAMSAAEKG